MKRSGTIDLSVSRIIAGVTPTDGRFSVQMLSDDVSATTTFNLEFSLDGTNWDVAVDNGTDVSDTLVLDETKLVSYESDSGLNFRIIFIGATTGTVNYIVNAA